MFSIPIDSSFGYHSASSIPEDPKAYLERTQRIRKFSSFSGYASMISVVALATLAISPFTMLATISSLLGYGISRIYAYTRICRTAGIIFNHNDLDSFKLAPKYGQTEAIATEHSADTELWRKRLIEQAEENIVISGNYCGGNAFVNFLDLVEKRIKERPCLKVVILSSPQFLTGKAKKRLDGLLKAYPTNFSLVRCPSIWHISPGLKKTTNHTKCMVVDYGKYFILGGSGIKDDFANTGLDDLSKEQFLINEGEPSLLKNSDESGFLSRLLPRDFRDQDWVFSSKDEDLSAGNQVYKQMLLLAYRWEKYNLSFTSSLFAPRQAGLSKSICGLFTGKATQIQPHQSITEELLMTPAKRFSEFTNQIDKFRDSAKKASNVLCKVFASGPEFLKSTFGAEVLSQIENAKSSIVINHMYFHPTPQVRQALIAAAKRGVKIEIITCGIYTNCPISHKIFGPRNKYNYSKIMNALSAEERRNVSIYEFQGYKKGNHKKLIIVDDETVIAGSSNLGYKSLVTGSDHELNFVAKSKKLAQETLRICQIDKDHSERVIKKEENSRWSLSIREHYRAWMHNLLSPLIG
jgi:phosphatidylserine/phosphatidylglycerophosphate/cardiolipin synthase-like enzyme